MYLKLLVLLVVVFTATGNTDGVKFERAEEVIWLPTKYRVDSGVILYQVNYKYKNICEHWDQLLLTKYINTHNTMPEKSIEQIINLCQEDYTNTWLQAISEFTKCMNDETISGKAKRLYTRWIIWFFVAAVIMIAAVSAIAATAIILERAKDPPLRWRRP